MTYPQQRLWLAWAIAAVVVVLLVVGGAVGWLLWPGPSQPLSAKSTTSTGGVGPPASTRPWLGSRPASELLAILPNGSGSPPGWAWFPLHRSGAQGTLPGQAEVTDPEGCATLFADADQIGVGGAMGKRIHNTDTSRSVEVFLSRWKGGSKFPKIATYLSTCAAYTSTIKAGRDDTTVVNYTLAQEEAPATSADSALVFRRAGLVVQATRPGAEPVPALYYVADIQGLEVWVDCSREEDKPACDEVFVKTVRKLADLK